MTITFSEKEIRQRGLVDGLFLGDDIVPRHAITGNEQQDSFQKIEKKRKKSTTKWTDTPMALLLYKSMASNGP